MDASAIAAFGAMLVAVIGAIFSGLASLRNGRKIDVVQTTVDGAHTESLRRTEQLATALTDAGVAVPPSPPELTVRLKQE